MKVYEKVLLTILGLATLTFVVAAIPILFASRQKAMPAEQPEKVVEKEVELIPELKRICSCESTGRPDQEPRQYDQIGRVLAGRINPADRGMCQLNQKYWLAVADKLGYDIETPNGNILMANYIYEKHGSRPWFWSASCWQE